MEHPVKAHIDHLERTVRELSEHFMRQDDVRLRNELEAKIRAADLALKHYRTALELERDLAQHE